VSGESPGSPGECPDSPGACPGLSGECPGATGECPRAAGVFPRAIAERTGKSGERTGNSGERTGASGERPGGDGEHPGRFGKVPGASGALTGVSGVLPFRTQWNKPNVVLQSAAHVRVSRTRFARSLSGAGERVDAAAADCLRQVRCEPSIGECPVIGTAQAGRVAEGGVESCPPRIHIRCRAFSPIFCQHESNVLRTIVIASCCVMVRAVFRTFRSSNSKGFANSKGVTMKPVIVVTSALVIVFLSVAFSMSPRGMALESGAVATTVSQTSVSASVNRDEPDGTTVLLMRVEPCNCLEESRSNETDGDPCLDPMSYYWTRCPHENCATEGNFLISKWAPLSMLCPAVPPPCWCGIAQADEGCCEVDDSTYRDLYNACRIVEWCDEICYDTCQDCCDDDSAAKLTATAPSENP
jgi:hypothetical protein